MIWGSSGARPTVGQVPRKQTLMILIWCTRTQALSAASQKGYLRVKFLPDFKSRGEKSQVHKLPAVHVPAAVKGYTGPGQVWHR